MVLIVDVEYLVDYRLELKFNTEESGIVDLADELNGSHYQPLKDKDLFKQYGLINGTIEWVNGADFAPEYLLKLMKEQSIPA